MAAAPPRAARVVLARSIRARPEAGAAGHVARSAACLDHAWRARRQGARGGRARRQPRLPGDHGGHSTDAGDPGRGRGQGAADDHVPRRRPARRSAPAAATQLPAAGATTGRRPAGYRATARGGLGLRPPQPRERPGRPRRRSQAGRHRARQPRPFPSSRRLGRVACLGLGREPGTGLSRNRSDGGRPPRRHRWGFPLWQGGAGHDGTTRASGTG
jgi:hypothetical protein